MLYNIIFNLKKQSYGKKSILMLMLMAAPVVVFAQLKVNSTGQVNAGPISPVNRAVVSAGDAYNYQYPSESRGRFF